MFHVRQNQHNARKMRVRENDEMIALNNFSLKKTEGVGLIFRAISFQDFQPGGLRKAHCSNLNEECVSAVQGHPRSLILVQIESAYVTLY